jgi:hypothetical protein
MAIALPSFVGVAQSISQVELLVRFGVRVQMTLGRALRLFQLESEDRSPSVLEPLPLRFGVSCAALHG